MGDDAWVVLGGAGFIGSAVRRRLHDRSCPVTVMDVAEPALLDGEEFRLTDFRGDVGTIPPGHVVLAFGQSMPRPVRPWTLLLDNVLATARAARSLVGREVTLLSSVEVYGAAPGPLTEETTPDLPVSLDDLGAWVDEAVTAARRPVSPATSAGLCRALADRDPGGRWVYALSKLAQEMVLRRAVEPESLTVLRLANVVGPGQHRLVGRLAEAMLSDRPCRVTSSVRSFCSVEDVARVVSTRPGPGTFNVAVGTHSIRDVARIVGRALDVSPRFEEVPAPAVDSSGVVDASRLVDVVGPLEPVELGLRRCARELAATREPLFSPPLPVVIPPRPHDPETVAERIGSALWSGDLRGGPASEQLARLLSTHLQVGVDQQLVLTNSGTNALRLAVSSVAGRPAPGDVALCPAYTFHATAEVLLQLGWTVRLVDVDPWTWTLDPELVARELRDPAVRLVVCVDALGCPADYAGLDAVCSARGVPLVADSAPALGATYVGTPVGTQARAHCFSMSFAKTVSGAGTGGAVVLPRGADLGGAPQWLRSSPMSEISAIAALDQVQVLAEMMARRRRVAGVYDAAVLDRPGFAGQHVRPGDEHAWVHWVLRVPRSVGRDRLAEALSREGVQTKNYYEPLGVPASGPLPVTEALHREALALPMSSELSDDDAERVAAALSRSLRRLGGRGAASLGGAHLEVAG